MTDVPVLRVAVAGVGAWAAGFEDWPALRRGLRTTSSIRPGRADRATERARPLPLLLPAAERRRVPDGVATALVVAREALADASRTVPVEVSTLASVFASAHGELAIVDYLCATLATDPLLVSPTRFHHSVHNAAAGYWSIATRSHGPTTSVAAGDDSFALGLVEAATQVVAENRPVLFVVFDTPAVGLLARSAPNTALFGAALLLAPPRHGATGAHLAIGYEVRASARPLPRHVGFHALAASSPAARALALLEGLALGADMTLHFPMETTSTISIDVRRRIWSAATPATFRMDAGLDRVSSPANAPQFHAPQSPLATPLLPALLPVETEPSDG